MSTTRRLSVNFQNQPGTVLEAMFVTLSVSRSQTTKWMYVSQVRRYGSIPEPEIYSWNTSSVPISVYEQSSDRVRSHFDEMLHRNFGVEKELPL
jgi:hypothetical protein